MYYIFAVEAQFYLPSFDQCTLPFLRDVLAGRKKLIKLRDLCMVNVPRLKDFKIDVLFDHAMRDPEARMYLPDPSKFGEKTVSRKFLYNVSTGLQNLLFAPSVNHLCRSFQH